jgi:hypothetical protein
MFKNKEIKANVEDKNNNILNLHEMIMDYNQTLQKFLINQKDGFSNTNNLNKNDYFFSGDDLNETKNDEIADIYADLKINTNQAKRNLKLENLNNLILELIDSHSKLDENLDELLVKLESQVNSFK